MRPIEDFDMRKISKAALTPVVAAIMALAAMPTAAMAQQKFSQMKAGWVQELGAAADLAGVLATVLGLFFAFKGVTKLKAHVDNPQDPSNKVTTGIFLLGIAALMITIPAVLGIGVSSIFGDTNSSTTLTQGFRELK